MTLTQAEFTLIRYCIYTVCHILTLRGSQVKISASGHTIHLTLQHFTPAKLAIAKMEALVMRYWKAISVLARITTLDRTVNVSWIYKTNSVVTYVLVSRWNKKRYIQYTSNG